MKETLERALKVLQQFVCGLTGHDALLHFTSGKITLLCSSCGHETPGWEIGERIYVDSPRDSRYAHVVVRGPAPQPSGGGRGVDTRPTCLGPCISGRFASAAPYFIEGE